MTKFLQGYALRVCLRGWSHGCLQRIQDGGSRHLEFRKKMSITLDCIKISAPNFMGRCITAPRRLPRDQRSKPEVNSCDVTSSSNERPEHKCVDLSDYSRYMIQVWAQALTLETWRNLPNLLDFTAMLTHEQKSKLEINSRDVII